MNIKVSKNSPSSTARLIRRSPKALTYFAALSLSSIGVLSTEANTTYSGSISGLFSAPVLSGSVIAVSGPDLFLNNTATAVFSGVGTNTINWGTSPSFSSISFVGKSFSGVSPDEAFNLGSITYTNGTSALDSLIFGATLTLSVSSFGVVIDPSVSALNFVTTSNGGVDPARDADFVSFNTFLQTFNVFENGTATAELYGKIVGDPYLVTSGIQLAPSQLGGFIGQGQPTPDDSASWALLAASAALLGFLPRRWQVASASVA